MTIEPEEKFSFFSKMSKFGIGNIVISLDFFVAFLIFLLLYIDCRFKLKLFISSVNDKDAFVQVILSASSVLFALITTALSIILSFSTSNFIKFLKRKGVLSGIIFPFWLGNGVYLCTIILAALYLLADQITWSSQMPYLFMTIVALFVYAIGVTFSLLRTIIRIGEWIAKEDDNLAS